MRIKEYFTSDYLLYLYNYCAACISMTYQDYGKALMHLKRCRRIQDSFDSSGKIYERTGKCYFQLKKHEKAKFFLLKALEFRKNPQKVNSEISSCLGIIYYHENDFLKARHYLELARGAYRESDFTDIRAVRAYLHYLACFS
jgi:tetratricopeptide (TPR) repeat protein